MKYQGIRLERTQDDRLLLFVGFEGGEWMPRWAEVRQLFEAACFTEAINSRGAPNAELALFAEAATFVKRLHSLVGVQQTSGQGG